MCEFYTYEKQKYSCEKCNWAGIGEQTEEILDLRDAFVIACPTCGHHLDVIMFPTIDETLKYGTEKQKEEAQQHQKFRNRALASRLKNCEQLPEIEADEIIITLREVGRKDGEDDWYIVLYWNEKEIWREIGTYEYYDRYIALGQILQNKYGSRLVDFETEYTMFLGGDYHPAFDEVKKFRELLRLNRYYCISSNY